MTEIHVASGIRFEDTALYDFMRAYGYADLAQMHLRAAEDPPRFWAEVEDALGLSWTRRYEAVCDLADGPMWPRWFVGGEIDLFDNLVGRLARDDPDRAAVIWEGEDGDQRQLSYSALALEAKRLAAALASLGVRRGDRIAMYMPMLAETVVVFLAAARLGAIVLPLFSGYGADAVAARLNDGEAAVMVCADGYLRRGRPVDMLAQARAAAAASPALADLVVVPRLGTPWSAAARSHWREWDYRSLVAAHEPGDGSASHAADTPLMIVYTSGTTGRPKGVVHTHTGFPLKAAQDMLMAFDLKPRDRILWVTDMGWMMGPWLVFGGLLRGATLALAEGNPDHPTPTRLWQLVERHGLTHLGLSPTLARLMMGKAESGLPSPGQLDSLRIFGSTGEPWNQAPWQWLYGAVGGNRRPIINYSGGTEIGGGILACFPGLPQTPCGFAGPIPGMQVDVLDGEGHSMIGANAGAEVGELVLRAPWPGMAHGFWRDRERYLETYWSRWPGVWVHGDWARVDREGHWFINGRSDDTLKIAGKRVGPAEYESVLVDHPLVAEAVAIGVPDPVKGEVAVCFVTLTHPQPASPAEWLPNERTLTAHLSARLGKALAPARVVPVDALPRTRNGKILRRLVRAIWLEQAAGDLGALENPAALDALRACRDKLLRSA